MLSSFKKLFEWPHMSVLDAGIFFSIEPVVSEILKISSAVDLLHPMYLPIVAYKNPAKCKCFIATCSLSENSQVF